MLGVCDLWLFFGGLFVLDMLCQIAINADCLIASMHAVLLNAEEWQASYINMLLLILLLLLLLPLLLRLLLLLLLLLLVVAVVEARTRQARKPNSSTHAPSSRANEFTTQIQSHTRQALTPKSPRTRACIPAYSHLQGKVWTPQVICREPTMLTANADTHEPQTTTMTIKHSSHMQIETKSYADRANYANS
jgi:hypothetical protein